MYMYIEYEINNDGGGGGGCVQVFKTHSSMLLIKTCMQSSSLFRSICMTMIGWLIGWLTDAAYFPASNISTNQDENNFNNIYHPDRIKEEWANQGNDFWLPHERYGDLGMNDKGLWLYKGQNWPATDVDKMFSKLYSKYVLFRNKYS